MEILKDLAPVLVDKNCYGYGNKKKFLTIHQTGNTARGANAKMHAQYQITNARMSVPREASWHWQVDDFRAIQSFEHSVQCWHASDGRGDGNLNSIAIEGCINVDSNYKNAVKNMAKLAAKILKDENIPLSNMLQHHDFARDKKNCPAQIRGGLEGITWQVFQQLVQNELDLLNGKVVVDGATVSKPVASKPQNQQTGGVLNMSGTFVTNDVILVRDTPSTSGRHIATYQKGESLKYDRAIFRNGYVWLEYNRSIGGKGYLPIAPLSEVWGTLK